MSEWRDNPGRLPLDALGKRVVVRLFNGRVFGEQPVTTTAKPGWEAGGPNSRGGCNWFISNPPHPYEIKQYRVL